VVPGLDDWVTVEGAEIRIDTPIIHMLPWDRCCSGDEVRPGGQTWRLLAAAETELGTRNSAGNLQNLPVYQQRWGGWGGGVVIAAGCRCI
jgi:hypothetical protein